MSVLCRIVNCELSIAGAYSAYGGHYFGLTLSCSRARLYSVHSVDAYEYQVEANPHLKIGEWNRIQITHEKGEEENFFVSLSVGDEELLKMEIDLFFSPEEKESTVAKISLGCLDSPHAFTSRLLVVAEKS